MKQGLLALGAGLVFGVGGMIGSAPATLAQECHPAYGGCLPIVYDLDCWEIGNAVVQVWDPYNDPYRLDDAYDVGNGWTCDGIG